MSLSSSHSSLGPPPSYSQDVDEIKVYLEDDEGKDYRWSLRDRKKRLLHTVIYGSNQAILKTSSETNIKVRYQEELGCVSLPVKLNLGNEDRSYILQAHDYTWWSLNVSCKSNCETYCLFRKTQGWDIHIDSPEGIILATFRKNHGETKLGNLVFTSPLTHSSKLAIMFSLTFAISTANARFLRELGIPASTETDRIEKYGDLHELQPSLTQIRSKITIGHLLRPTISHQPLPSSTTSSNL